MQIRFDTLPLTQLDRFYGGEGTLSARLFRDDDTKIMRGTLPPGTSIGMHCHSTSCEVIFILAGTGRAECDGVCEPLAAGACHYCPQGSSHALYNDGPDALLFLAVVPEVRTSKEVQP